jgi:hypothetical protein
VYAIFESPLFSIALIFSFVGGSFDFKSSKNKILLIKDMEKLLESKTKWLKISGLKVNHDKTDLCLFHIQETATVRTKIGDIVVL